MDRSPLENILNVLGSLPQGHDKAVKHALYNAVAIFLLFMCCAAGYAVYIILEPFIKPLIWAVLVGSALHPLRRSLKYRFQIWLETLEASKTPIVLGIVLLPVNIVDSISEFMCKTMWKKLRIIIVFGVLVLVIPVVYHYTPDAVTSIMLWLVVSIWNGLNFFVDSSSLWIIVSVVLGYSTIIFFLWKPENNVKFQYASISVWLLCSSFLAQYFGSLQVPMFILLQIVLFIGFVSEVYTIYEKMNDSGYPVSIIESLGLAFHFKHENNYQQVKEESEENSEMTENIRTDTPKMENEQDSKERLLDQFRNECEKIEEPQKIKSPGLKIGNVQQHSIQKSKLSPTKMKSENTFHTQSQSFLSKFDEMSKLMLGRKLSPSLSSRSLVDTEGHESTFYLLSVFWACLIMVLWKNTMLLLLLPLPIIFNVVKHIGLYIGLWKYIDDEYNRIIDIFSVWCQDRHDALVPIPIRGLYHVVHKINIMMKTVIRKSMDTVASFLVIFGLLIFLICASVFITLQIYAEAITVVQTIGNVLNQTVVQNPELRQLLPPAWDETMDSILDNAYQYGREGLSKVVNGMMSNVDSTKSEKLEKHVLELWDRIYQNWMSTNDCNGPKVTEDAVQNSWDNFLRDIQKTPEMFQFESLMEIGKQNFGTLVSLLESLWSILKGNMTLILGSFSAFLSVILGGGSAVMNFMLNVVVFLTTLFYLLNGSGDLYKPVEILTNFSSSGKRFGHALEEAVNGVFFASFKMAAFYGMWTWFIHNLFGLKIVYLPTAFATILGAVPFLGTYWACIPAVLDLWLAKDTKLFAIIFAIFQLLPTSIVDTTIYKEIKGGGHPYLTGLAIAGGIFCLGVEGAIMGPMILCGLYVAINLSSFLLKDSQETMLSNLQN